MRRHNVDISTNGGDENSVAVSPNSMRINSGDSVTFRDSNSGESPTSIQVTFPSNITCLVNGEEVTSLNVPVDGSVAASLEGGASEGNYTVQSHWGDAVKTASPVIIVD
jgi:hypothetical protein